MNRNHNENCRPMRITDCGPRPFVIDLTRAAEQNINYRTALWTGEHLQMTLMCIPVGGEIGLEKHPDTDQLIRVESGSGMAMMGKEKDCLHFQCPVCDGSAVFVPACTWHNIINTGDRPLKLYTVYAPPHHPHGIVQKTKECADAGEKQEKCR